MTPLLCNLAMQSSLFAQVRPGQPPVPSPDAGAMAAFGIGMLLVWLFVMVVFALIPLVSLWVIFSKAGKPGWAAIIPIYNIIVMVEIIKKDTMWIILMLIPCTAPIWGILSAIELAKVFGKDTGFALGMIFLPFIFYPILAFGDARYEG